MKLNELTEAVDRIKRGVDDVLQMSAGNNRSLADVLSHDDADKILYAVKQGNIEGALDIISSVLIDKDGGELKNFDVYIKDVEDELKAI